MAKGIMLKYGSTGIAVSALQWWLNESMVADPPLAVDGIYGTYTRRAVMAFQRSAGLMVDGITGPQTWGAIAEGLSSAPSAPTQVRRPPSNRPSRLPYAFVPAVYRRSAAKYLAAGDTTSSSKAAVGLASGSTAPTPHPSMVDPYGLGFDVNGATIIGVIYFETDSHSLDGDDIRELNKLKAYAETLKKRSLIFECEGWADPRGDKKHNQILSKERANTVSKYIKRWVLPQANAQCIPNGKGAAIGPKVDNPLQRSCLIKAEALQRKKKKKPPNLQVRIFKATVAVVYHHESTTQLEHLLCMLSKMQQGLNLNKNLKDLRDKNFGFYSKSMTTFKQEMDRTKPRNKVTPAEDKAWWVFVAEHLESPAYGPKKTSKQMSSTLHGLDIELQESMAIVYQQATAAGGAGVKTPNAALEQVYHLLEAKMADKSSVYSCWEDALKR